MKKSEEIELTGADRQARWDYHDKWSSRLVWVLLAGIAAAVASFIVAICVDRSVWIGILLTAGVGLVVLSIIAGLHHENRKEALQ